ncbi:PREDICTED: MICOS complex subunit MIC60 [Fragaria vesca subsp. vesca]|uniref:MICOS complex subunit MIC60 n=1 Tax=Fragaria vesca subsp. vesca TaxID=101020 RepID=UPI0002C30CB6|nr:PREDICTED: MICOS complex subunit MIC60 [Fragaria vesca subsp. vesca]
MLRRSLLQISSRRAVRRIQSPHIPRFLRKEFSAAVQNPAAAPGGPEKPPEKSGGSNAFVLGGLVVGGGAALAYGGGYLDSILGLKKKAPEPEVEVNANEEVHVEEYKPREEEESSKVSFAPEVSEEKGDARSEDASKFEGLSGGGGESEAKVEDQAVVSDVTDEKDLGEVSENAGVGVLSEEKVGDKSGEKKTSEVPKEEVETAPVVSDTDQQEIEIKALAPQQKIVEEKAQDAIANVEEPPSSLLSAYNLKDGADGGSESNFSTQGSNENNPLPKEKEAFTNAVEGLDDAYISKDRKLVLDFLEAIHAAESRQAELDQRVSSEEKRALKEKYEKKLKDAGIREAMLAQEAAVLEKELKREKAKAVQQLKSLQEKLEEKYKTELEQKENEAEMKVKEVEELAKAELAATIAREKASQIEKIAEADLHIKALCVAFYARSEEARQTHSAHKLALGALALEDALSKGLPIQTELEALNTYLEGIDKDSILDLVLSSLPEETLKSGTDTILQLNQKFDSLKGPIRHFSLMPPGGGGLVANTLARIASSLKVKEVDQSGDGIESVMNKVECYLAEGKLVEAAEALEEGVRGTQAAAIVGDWVKRARNRAITEQALTLLESYATSISVT